MTDAINGWARFVIADFGPLDTVVIGDTSTWTLAEDFLSGGWHIATRFNVVRFSPAWTVAGTPHHFETVIENVHDGYNFSEQRGTYATEAEARDGHHTLLLRLRTSLEARRRA